MSAKLIGMKYTCYSGFSMGAIGMSITDGDSAILKSITYYELSFEHSDTIKILGISRYCSLEFISITDGDSAILVSIIY
jgi:hypothetical protein